MRILSLGALGALAVTLAACGSPVSESIRPQADEGSCPRIDGQVRCSNGLTTSKNPAEKMAF